ncbi:putative nucleic acid-binding protein [Mucilaginibacter gracilis]|uniref:Putative nucleic acid-binding protein n=1 Tax=Mucilaginibacter gracilis TaxID=423350 RepID=A0A495IXC4_9SPHI|nr:PIN domain-containing protein [Mucilaginibacter gracilis]RKR81346.1 putative nucleic acid-binding protein [Mucilaginibacter gracilis]
MSNIAIDTNILLYALDDFYPEKQNTAIQIIADKPLFCSQTVSEFANVCLRKWKFPKSKVAELIKTYLQQGIYVPVSEQMIVKAADIMNKYDFQLFDSIIISFALESGCSLLYSEDMNNGQIIEKQLTIVNPFTI